MIDLSQVGAFFQVVMVDVTLAGDNAIVVGLAAGGLPKGQRRKAIVAGTAIATVLRILLAFIATRFLAVIGMTLAGGLLLLWVAWKTFREIMGERHETAEAARLGRPRACPQKTVRQAMVQIVIADISMSIDNVLAVAGIARQHVWVLAAGLVLSVALMGAASTLVARLLQRMPWLVWLGLAIMTYVACNMVYEGVRQIHGA